MPMFPAEAGNHKFKVILNYTAGLPVWATRNFVSARNETQSGEDGILGSWYPFPTRPQLCHQAGILPSPVWMFCDGFLFTLFSPLAGLDEVKSSCYTACQSQVK